MSSSRCAGADAGKRLFVEGSPGVAVFAADALVVIAAAVCPQAVVLTEQQGMVALHLTDDAVYAVCASCAFVAGNKTRQCILGLSHRSIGGTAVPPRCLMLTSHQQCSVLAEPAVLQGIDGVAVLFAFAEKRLVSVLAGGSRCGKRLGGGGIAVEAGRVNPLLHGDTRFQCLLSHPDGFFDGWRRRSVGVALQHATLLLNSSCHLVAWGVMGCS